VERDRWQRWSPFAGIAFAVLFLSALGVSGSGPVVWLAWVLAISLVLMVRTARVAGRRGAST
jgi:hypothetical protein